jgi:hypothetical protein
LLITKEADRSSRIEGIHADLGDVYPYEAGVQLEESLLMILKESSTTGRRFV